MLLTIPEACEALKMGKTRLYSLITKQEIRAIKNGKKTLLEKSELERWVSSLPPYQSQNQHA